MTNEGESENQVVAVNVHQLTMASSADIPAVRFLVCGDICGWFNDLTRDLERIERHQGPFTFAICMGSFLGDSVEYTCIEQAVAENDYFGGRKQFPIPVYFIDASHSKFGGFLRTKFHDVSYQFSPTLTYLGGFGFCSLFNVRIGFLSGLYNADYFFSESEDEEDVDIYGLESSVTEDNQEAKPALCEENTNNANRDSTINESSQSSKNKMCKNKFFTGPFNEYYSQRVMQTMRDLCVQFSGQTDAFFSCTWPMGYNENLVESKKAELNQLMLLAQSLDASSTLLEFESPALSELIEFSEPRFHVATGCNLFYQRPLYRTSSHGLTSKFIGLGNIKYATRVAIDRRLRFLHALVLKPISTYGQNRTALLATPNNATESPYYKIYNPNSLKNNEHKRPSLVVDSQNNNAKRPKNDSLDSNTVCVSNLPFLLTDSGVAQIFSQFGEVSNVDLLKYNDGKPTGRAYVTFKSPEHAENSIAASYKCTAAGRTLKITKMTPNWPNDRSSRSNYKQVCVDLSPHAGICCFGQGGLVPQHCLIVPVTHFPNLVFCPVPVVKEFSLYIDALRECYKQQGFQAIVFERFLPMRTTTGMHMQLQVIPISNEYAKNCLQQFEEKSESAGCPLTRLNAVDNITVLRHIVPNEINQPYFYIELPENNKRHQVARFLFLGSTEENLPFNFGREVVADIIDAPSRANWKNCVDPSHVEVQLANDLSAKLKPFLPDKSTNNNIVE